MALSRIRDYLIEQFEITHGNARSNKQMEGLRGIAVTLVFFVHYSILFRPYFQEHSAIRAFADTLAIVGSMDVDLFFVMSGYLIYGAVVGKNNFQYKAYFFRRIQRIYPTFAVVLTIYLVLSVFFPSESKLPNNLPDATLYIVENFLLLPGLFPIEPIMTVAWSLSYEVFYYLAIPLIVAALRLRKVGTKARLIVWSVLSFSIFGLYLVYGGGPIRLSMFLSGIFLFELEGKIKARGTPAGDIAFLLAMGAVGATVFVGQVDIAVRFAHFVLLFIVGLYTFAGRGQLGRVCGYLPVRWLGNSSYSFYLIHGLALQFLFLILGKTHLVSDSNNVFLFLVLIIPFFVVAFVVSSVLFLIVERPLSLSQKVHQR